VLGQDLDYLNSTAGTNTLCMVLGLLLSPPINEEICCFVRSIFYRELMVMAPSARSNQTLSVALSAADNGELYQRIKLEIAALFNPATMKQALEKIVRSVV
jgi:hypothetical protein